MAKEKLQTKVYHFTNNNGDSRHFVICALSEEFSEVADVNIYDEVFDTDQWITSAVKGVRLGWAICNPVDTFNEKIGIKIAEGRARHNTKYALYSTSTGYINTKMIDAFLDQEAEFFMSNPATKIAGYKRKK